MRTPHSPSAAMAGNASFVNFISAAIVAVLLLDFVYLLIERDDDSEKQAGSTPAASIAPVQGLPNQSGAAAGATTTPSTTRTAALASTATTRAGQLAGQV